MLIHSASQLLTLSGEHQRGSTLGSLGVIPNGAVVMRDEKIIAVPTAKLTKRYDRIQNYSDLPEITLEQIQHFFEHYKDLEPNKWVKVLRWGNADVAHQLLIDGIRRAKEQRG